MAGPIYAFELFLDDLLAGKDRRLVLRSGDELKVHIEDLAEKLRKELLLKKQDLPNESNKKQNINKSHLFAVSPEQWSTKIKDDGSNE